MAKTCVRQYTERATDVAARSGLEAERPCAPTPSATQNRGRLEIVRRCRYRRALNVSTRSEAGNQTFTLLRPGQEVVSMSSAPTLVARRSFGNTMRRDLWWVQPLVGFPRTLDLHRLRHLGGVSGRALHVRTVPLAVLFSGDLRRFAAQLVRAATGGLARMAAVFARAADPPDPWPLPADLLLLPRRLLQGVLGGSAVLHGGRAEVDVLGREFVSPHPAEHPSLHAVPLARGARHSRRSTPGKRCGSPIRPPARSRSASEWARWCWPRMSCSSAGICSAAIRCGISPAAASISCRARRSVSTRTPA